MRDMTNVIRDHGRDNAQLRSLLLLKHGEEGFEVQDVAQTTLDIAEAHYCDDEL